MTQQQREILCDAQTSGGLLVIVRKGDVPAFLETAKEEGLELSPIGETLSSGAHLIEVV